MSTAPPLLGLHEVSKSFGPVTVIDKVSLEIYSGQVLALLGENGAGKSTIIKMIAGIYQPTSGEILVEGTPTEISTVHVAQSLGIATIHQELNLVPTMSVAENILLGRTPNAYGLLRKRQLRQEAQDALDLIGLQVDIDAPVSTLGIAQQQMVEIAKALSTQARVLILDEPTAALTEREVAQLFNVLRQLREQGVAMVFISHHLDEIAAIADQVSVLRDGKFIATVPADTDQDELVRLMVGRSIDNQYPRLHPADSEQEQPPLLEVNNLCSTDKFEDISFQVRPGEILGIAGLVGAGRTEILRAIANVDPYDSGQVLVQGKPVGNTIPAAIKAGIGLVPEDRKAQGLVLDASVGDNLGLATLQSTARCGLADLRGQRDRALDVAKQLTIRMSSITQPIRNLSGGNQQKAVFGRWVLRGSTILLLDEPTRGVDVGAKVEIYNIMNQITAAGGAVVMVSSELPEVIGMSDRILVLSNGRIAGELAAGATQDEIMSLAVANVKDHVTTPSKTVNDFEAKEQS